MKQALKRVVRSVLQTTHYPLKTNSAFTLIELLIVIAIMVVVSVVGVTSFFKYRNGQNLKLSMQQVAAAIQDAERRSATQQDGKQWAIRLTNATSSQKFETWSGSNYASGTVAQSSMLRNGIRFGNPPSGNFLDLVFSGITGQPVSGTDTVVSMNDGNGDGLVSDIIVGALGKISANYDNGLAGYWHFDEGASSTVYDASGTGNNGTLVNGPTWQTGSSCEAGSCLSFNGTSNISVSGSSNMDLSQGTIAGWFKISSMAGGVSFSVGTAWLNERFVLYFGYPGNGKIKFTTSDGSAYQTLTSNLSPTLGQWYFIAVTFDGSTKTIYVNGNVDSSASSSIIPATKNVPLSIGKTQGLAPDSFSGNIDEVRIYNRALSATEIQTMYNDLK